MEPIRKGLKKAASFLNVLGAGALVMCTVISFVNVVARYVFNSPFSWGDELTVLMLAWFVYLPQAALEYGDKQLQLTVVYNAVGRRVRLVFNILRSLVTAAMGLSICYWGYKVIMMNYELAGKTMALRLPLWITYIILPLSMLLVALVRIFDLLVEGEVKKPC
jgi:TRAP-type C4-dicarboxylate transport system permease small subunit